MPNFFISVSQFNTSEIEEGNIEISFISDEIVFPTDLFKSKLKKRANCIRVTIVEVSVLVAATPISCPALIRMVESEILDASVPNDSTIEITLHDLFLKCSIADNVSAVSPD